MLIVLDGKIGPLIGHRGAMAVAPENTRHGFLAAKAAGISWVEFDVMLTKDRVPVLHHDETWQRTTTGYGPVADTMWKEASAFDAGVKFSPQFQGEPVLSLEQAVTQLAELGLNANIEIKPTRDRDEETAELVTKMVLALWPDVLPPPIISSFSERALRVSRQIAPGLPRALLVGNLPKDWPDRMGLVGATAIHLSAQNSASDLKDLLAAQVPIRVYTVNDAKKARVLFDLGVEAVFTDNPEDIKEAMD